MRFALLQSSELAIAESPVDSLREFGGARSKNARRPHQVMLCFQRKRGGARFVL